MGNVINWGRLGHSPWSEVQERNSQIIKPEVKLEYPGGAKKRR